jgi:hypothetical protein
VIFCVLLIVSLAMAGSTREEDVIVVPYVLWIGVVLAPTWLMPTRKGAVKNGRVVQLGERRAGKRRALNATIWGWVLTIGGGLMTLFFTWQLISPSIVLRDQGWKALIAAVSVMVLVGQYFFDVVRRSEAAPETLPVSTASALYLRAFDEEKRPFVFGPRSVLKKYTSQFAAHAPFTRGDPTLTLTLEDYLEEAITAQIGPFVGLGNPYDKTAPDGATREYAPDDQWQTRFVELARNARCIMVSIGGSANLEWELAQIKERGLGQKLCLFTSPIAPGTDRTLVNRLRRTATKRTTAVAHGWTESSEVLRRVGFNCATNPGPGAAVTFDEHGNSTIITTDANWPADFIAPVADWFKDNKRTGDCYACREKEAHARRPFFDRHPVFMGAWALAALFIAPSIATVVQITSAWLVVPLWLGIVVLPVVLHGMEDVKKCPSQGLTPFKGTREALLPGGAFRAFHAGPPRSRFHELGSKRLTDRGPAMRQKVWRKCHSRRSSIVGSCERRSN